MSGSGRLRSWVWLIGAAALSAAGLGAGPGVAGGCHAVVPDPHGAATARRFADANVDNPAIFSVGANGNEYMMLSPAIEPTSARDLAGEIRRDPKYAAAKSVLLEWSFSTRGTAPLAHELQQILGKPVIGFSGPLWLYSDGAAISGRSDSGLTDLTQGDVGECVDHEGRYHVGADCAALLASHKGMAHIFTNMLFARDCDQIARLEQYSRQGDHEASLRLFYYYALVDRDAGLERKYQLLK